MSSIKEILAAESVEERYKSFKKDSVEFKQYWK
jgi:hypothetical protein